MCCLSIQMAFSQDMMPSKPGSVHTGLPEPVWAAALAANWDRKVKDLVDDIYGDHNYMVCCSMSCPAVNMLLHLAGIYSPSGRSQFYSCMPSPDYIVTQL